MNDGPGYRLNVWGRTIIIRTIIVLFIAHGKGSSSKFLVTNQGYTREKKNVLWSSLGLSSMR